MKRVTIDKNEIYIVESHNQVLEAWESQPGLNVFSLDYHTDTKAAFSNYSYWRADSEVKSGRCSQHDERQQELVKEKISQYRDGLLSISQVNDNLKHDEHLDFAVRTDIVKMVFVLSTNRNTASSNPNVYLVEGPEKYEEQRIIEFSPICIPECNKELHGSDCETLRADSSLEDSFLMNAILCAENLNSTFFDNYILDIDCDFFNTKESLYPAKNDVFKRLIRDARMITIALEPECVKICRHKGSDLTSDTILDRLRDIMAETKGQRQKGISFY